MPTFTYMNLPAERKKKIIRISLEEFSAFQFEKASLSRIIKKVGVAKGSFYRYFRNKLDLYSYLFDMSSSLRVEDSEELKLEELDFREFLFQYFLLSIIFEMHHPLHGRFYQKAMREPEQSKQGQVIIKSRIRAVEHLLNCLEYYKNQGEIKEAYPLEYISFQVTHNLKGVRAFLKETAKQSFPNEESAGIPQLSEEKIREVIGTFVDMISMGLGMEKGEGRDIFDPKNQVSEMYTPYRTRSNSQKKGLIYPLASGTYGLQRR
jgi:AcrR family transcriptional regulator